MKFQSILSLLILAIFVTFTSCSDEGLDPQVPDTTVDMDGDTDPNDGNDTEALETAPDFNIKTYEGEDLQLSAYEGQVLVIWFFGSECPPCIAIGATVEEELNEKFRDVENYAIIGMDQWDRNDATVEGFQEKTGVQFPLGAKGGSVASEYGTTYDRLVVINKEGKIEYKATARANSTLDDVVTLVRKLTQ